VRDARKAVHGGLAQGSVDKEAVVVADEGEGDDADGLEDSVVDKEATS